MQIYILNKAYEIIAMIDEADSILWHSKYNDTGECEVYLPCTNEALDIFQKDYYIYRYDDDMCCQIKNIKVTTDVENGDYLVVTGYDIVSIVSGRCVWNEINFNGLACNFIKQLLDETIINPTWVQDGVNVRKIRNFEFDDSNFDDFSEIISYQTNHEDVYQLIKGICQSLGYGFRLSFDIDEKKFIFKLYKGVDRSNPSGDSYIEFSPNYANILSTEYEENNENYKNSAMVIGKYLDDQIITEVVGSVSDGAYGINRYEIFVDATNISPTYKDSRDVEHTYSIPEFRQLLINRGNEVLAERKLIKSFKGSVDTIDTYEYKTDYNLGDYVKVINEYGISSTSQITDVLESDDNENGYIVEPTFK